MCSGSTKTDDAGPYAAPAPPVRFILVLVSDRTAMDEAVRGLLDPTWRCVTVSDRRLLPEPGDADLVLLDVPTGDDQAFRGAFATARRLREAAVPAVAVGDRFAPHERVALLRAGISAVLPLDGDGEEFAAQIESLLHAKRPAAQALKRLQEHTRHLDEQLRLAQRLQMDFLPRQLPGIPGGRFAARLEPAAWVAGDFYDIFRLDEQHVGFYIADAVGHGIPAALLTVFVKKSLQTKRIDGHRYELIPPDEALQILNAELKSAQLQQTPFITMVYGIYNVRTQHLVYSRAGHPRPLLIEPNGAMSRMPGEGSLLGIFDDGEFERAERTLKPGQRILLYTDGAERIESPARADEAGMFDLIEACALLPAEAMLDEIVGAVHAASDEGRLADDVTLVTLDLDPPGAPAE